MIFDIHPVPVSIQEDCWSVEWNRCVVGILSFLVLAGLIQGCILVLILNFYIVCCIFLAIVLKQYLIDF